MLDTTNALTLPDLIQPGGWLPLVFAYRVFWGKSTALHY